ncbi:hypothetical protein AA313_de0205646 [Arthrobotrys entomopaga]|nr:hypothetical protein AA313_de0205646 [Arthrobotrys entomopaga]
MLGRISLIGANMVSTVAGTTGFALLMPPSSSSADLSGATESTTRMPLPRPFLVLGIATAVMEAVAIVAFVFKGPFTIGFPAIADKRSFLRCSKYLALKSGSTNQSSLLFAEPASLFFRELPAERPLVILLGV